MILGILFVSRKGVYLDVDQDVINTFKHSKARKNPGPDNIEDRLLISSA